MADIIPPWLATMRSLKGTDEFAGGADNPIILSWRDFISRTYPEMATYCRNYTHDDVPWCGLTMAYVMAVNGIRPVFGPTDTDKFLWADAWRQFGTKLEQPRLGCVMVFTRDGGGHVALYEGDDGDNYRIVGGNQSDSVNVTSMSKSRFSGAFWPREVLAQIPKPAPGTKRFADITATVFADSSVAYPDVEPGWNGRPGVALPAWIDGERPMVRVWKDGKSVDCEIIDQGPWNYTQKSKGLPGDPYWETGVRPQAESGTDMTGRKTNLAGIDLTPAAADAISLDGKGLVDWEFIGETEMPDVQVIPPRAQPDLRPLIEALLPLLPILIEALQKSKGGQLPPLLPPPVTQPPPVAAPPPSALQRPSVMGSVIGLVISAATTYFGAGVIPPIVGEVAMAAFGGTAMVGSTGFFGAVKNFIDRRLAARYAPK